MLVELRYCLALLTLCSACTGSTLYVKPDEAAGTLKIGASEACFVEATGRKAQQFTDGGKPVNITREFYDGDGRGNIAMLAKASLEKNYRFSVGPETIFGQILTDLDDAKWGSIGVYKTFEGMHQSPSGSEYEVCGLGTMTNSTFKGLYIFTEEREERRQMCQQLYSCVAGG